MEKIKIEKVKEIEPESPILIEGLPGIGMVGKLSVNQLKKQLETEKYAEMKSDLFAPQVNINEDAEIEPRKNEIYYHEREDGEDILLLTGEEQGTTPRSQHLLSQTIVKEAHKLGTSYIYTLGGLGTKQLNEDPQVFGAVTDKELKKEYEEYGVKFNRQGPIIGAAGLLLEYGKRKGIPGICLMGQTHGKFIDPNAAKNILQILEEDLELEIEYEEINEKSKEMKKAVNKMMKQQSQQQTPSQPADQTETPTEYIH